MKYMIILLIGLMSSKNAMAVPVVNENVANSGVLTIYPDSADAHRFYIAPNIVMIARDQNKRPYFSYAEYRKAIFSIVGVMQMTLVPAYTQADMDSAKAEILKKDPNAQFSGLPFISSSTSLTGDLPELIRDNQCNHVGGLIGQEQSCTMVLTSKGRDLFYRALERKTIFTMLQYEYSVQAVVKKADGSYADQVISHGVAVRIDGDQLSQFPELIERL